jgi:hypothetical protein
MEFNPRMILTICALHTLESRNRQIAPMGDASVTLHQVLKSSNQAPLELPDEIKLRSFLRLPKSGGLNHPEPTESNQAPDRDRRRLGHDAAAGGSVRENRIQRDVGRTAGEINEYIEKRCGEYVWLTRKKCKWNREHCWNRSYRERDSWRG